VKKRPVIKIEPSDRDQQIDFLTLIITLFLITLPCFFILQLPDTIPMHFDFKGNIDRYGSKHFIWILPIIGLVTHLSLKHLLKFPHTYNYITPVTEDNAERLYRSGQSIIRYTLLFTQIVFLLITIAIIYSAMNTGKNILGPWFTISILSGGIIVPIIMAYKLSQNTK